MLCVVFSMAVPSAGHSVPATCALCIGYMCRPNSIKEIHSVTKSIQTNSVFHSMAIIAPVADYISITVTGAEPNVT
jgi:hypothetical protein